MSLLQSSVGHFRGKPCGRDLDPRLLEGLRELLGDERQDATLRRRDLLIEHLHVIQDTRGHLLLADLRALAAYMNLPMAAVYETATFYAHFDVIHDDQQAPPAVTIRVCDSLTCQLAGAEALKAQLEANVDIEQVRVPPVSGFSVSSSLSRLASGTLMLMPPNLLRHR